jgi:predicted RNase H-like HicB family nuclease
MDEHYTAVTQQQGEWWIGWVEEVPGVSSRGATRAELLENLGSALEVMLAANAEAWLAEASHRYEELRTGAVEGVPADLVLARIRERLR